MQSFCELLLGCGKFFEVESELGSCFLLCAQVDKFQLFLNVDSLALVCAGALAIKCLRFVDSS